jgi:L-ascorbate metabolism protein UlaG (beta-lactamase superfamily)
MTVTWLGQAGFLLRTGKATILIDPYLSDSAAADNFALHRRVPADERFLRVRPDVLVITHDHADHYDPSTLRHYLQWDSAVTVLAPASVWKKVQALGGRCVLMRPGTEWTEYGVRVRAVRADHTDPCAIGAIVTELETEKAYYFTGDTLYNGEILASLPGDLFAVFVPINGVGGNMNREDAARFARQTGARYAVPMHFGLMDDLRGEDFPSENKVVPRIYEEIPLPDGD